MWRMNEEGSRNEEGARLKKWTGGVLCCEARVYLVLTR